MGLCDSGGQQNTVSEFKPPSYTQPGWQNAVGMAGQLLDNPYNPYTGMQPGAAPINSDQSRAGDMVYQTAVLGSPDVNAARGANTDFANGMYLGSNPWLSDQYTNNAISQNASAMANAYATGTAAQRSAKQATAGAYGGSAANEADAMGGAGLANSIGQMANNYQLQHQNAGAADWQQGLGQMLQGAQGGLNGQSLDLNAANALQNWGQFQQDYTNKLAGIDQGNWNNANNYGQTQLQNYLNMLSQASGGGTQTVSGGANSPWANLLGGGTAALSAYNLFKTT